MALIVSILVWYHAIIGAMAVATASTLPGCRWGISFVRKKGEARELVPGLFV
nr:MAG TPA: hypothetical protein [Siphoviridae sp. ctKRf14]